MIHYFHHHWRVKSEEWRANELGSLTSTLSPLKRPKGAFYG